MRKQSDERPPLSRALDAAGGLKPGTWESVEALALLAIEARGLPQSGALLEAAHATASRLKPGTWASVQALACLARADRELSER